MVKALFDTNVLIDFLNAVPEARHELAPFSKKAISIVTWMPVMIGAQADIEARTRAFLRGFNMIELQNVSAARAVELRPEHRLNCQMQLSGRPPTFISCFWSHAMRQIFPIRRASASPTPYENGRL
jgi:predicted nucleic acid-binding protein